MKVYIAQTIYKRLYFLAKSLDEHEFIARCEELLWLNHEIKKLGDD